MENLIFPHSFTQQDRDFLISEFKDYQLSESIAQDVIYETMARIEMRHSMKYGPVKYCLGIAKKAAAGQFTLNLGLKIKLRIEKPNPKTEFNPIDGTRFVKDNDQSIWVFRHNVAQRADGKGSVIAKTDFVRMVAEGRFLPA